MIADISLLTKHNLSHWYTLTHYILQVYVLSKYLLHFRNTLIEQHRRAGQRGMESIPSGVIVMRGTLKGYEQPIFSISGPSSLQGPRLALTISPPLSPSPRGPHLHVDDWEPGEILVQCITVVRGYGLDLCLRRFQNTFFTAKTPGHLVLLHAEHPQPDFCG